MAVIEIPFHRRGAAGGPAVFGSRPTLEFGAAIHGFVVAADRGVSRLLVEACRRFSSRRKVSLRLTLEPSLERLADGARVDFAIVDLEAVGGGSEELIATLLAGTLDHVRLIGALGGDGDPESTQRILDAGASCYLSRSALGQAPENVAQAVERWFEGAVPLTQKVQ